ncbi:MAG: WD40/YVTN/BNR-like repeat-containing protein [Roseiflexaceae bacterium]
MAKAGLLFVGTDDGIVLFSDPGGVGRWFRVGQELRGRAIRAVWPAADTPLVVLVAADDAGLQRSDDGGQSWRQALDADVRSIAGHPRAPHALYLGAADGAVYRGADAGASWELCPRDARPAEGGAAYVVVAPGDLRRLYLGLGSGGAWSSADGGDHWARYGEGLLDNVTEIVADPAQPGALYAVAGGALYHCAAAEARWEPAGAVRAGQCVALAALPGKVPVLLAAWASGGIARSDDGGASWSAVAPDVAWQGEVTTIAAARYHIDTAFAGSAGGQLAQSADRGRTWQVLKSGLGPIRSIAAARLA